MKTEHCVSESRLTRRKNGDEVASHEEGEARGQCPRAAVTGTPPPKPTPEETSDKLEYKSLPYKTIR